MLSTRPTSTPAVLMGACGFKPPMSSNDAYTVYVCAPPPIDLPPAA